MVVAGEFTPRPGKSAFTLLVEPCGPVAQLVEQGTENPCVGGSTPPQATIFMGKWCNGSHARFRAVSRKG